MNYFKWIALVSILSPLAGCSHATLSKAECLRSDWFTLGVQDGNAGKNAGEINLHKDACFEYGITPDQKQYMEGREKGLAEYCKLENAVTTGLSGQLYQNVCPKEVDDAFRKQNLAAYNLYLSYMRNASYNNYYYNGIGGYAYPGYGGYYGGFGNYGYGGYVGGSFGGRGGGFRPFGGFGFGGRRR